MNVLELIEGIAAHDQSEHISQEELINRVMRETVKCTVLSQVMHFRNHILNRCVQNQHHKSTNYKLGIVPQYMYDYWMASAGDQGMSCRSRAKRECRGKKETDPVKLHKFYGDLLDTISLFNREWWTFVFQETGPRGRCLRFEIIWITFSYNLVTHQMDCSLGYDIKARSAHGWEAVC
jgi:hypothetical protein